MPLKNWRLDVHCCALTRSPRFLQQGLYNKAIAAGRQPPTWHSKLQGLAFAKQNFGLAQQHFVQQAHWAAVVRHVLGYGSLLRRFTRRENGDSMAVAKARARVIVLLKRMAKTHSIAKACAEELQEVLCAWDDLDDPPGVLANLLGSEDDPASLFDRPIVSATSMTITWGGHSCRLGNTVLFRLMERLARRPNQFIPVDRLIRDVWDGCRSDEAVRQAVMRLRRQLKKARMPGLAKAIRGLGDHYGLILDKTL